MMSVYRTTSPLTTFYNNDYRPDDEPPPEAILEEKRILGHHLRRPSPTRWAPSLNSSMQPPTTLRPGTSQSMRVRTSGSSPRRSLQRSTAFRSKRSLTITDRGRTASMPAVPVTHVSKLSRLSLLKCILALYWIVIILYLDPDPVILIRIKAQHLETGSGPKATVLFLVTKYLKSLIIIIHAIKSIDILNIINDVRLLEERINCKAPKYYTGIAALVGVLFTIFEVIFDYQWQSLSTPKWIFYLEGISRVCLFSIDLQFFDLCIRTAAMYKKLNKNLILVYRFKKTIQHNKGIENLSKTNMEFMNLNKISTKINQSYSSQLFLIVGLHFYSVLVNVYLFVFHTFALGIPWTVILNLRFLNTLWRLNIICGAAHYTVNQALHVYRKLGQLRTSCVGPKDIEEIEIIFFQYNVENLSFTLFGIMKLDFSLMLLFLDSVFRCSLILIQYNWMDNAFKVN